MKCIERNTYPKYCVKNRVVEKNTSELNNFVIMVPIFHLLLIEEVSCWFQRPEIYAQTFFFYSFTIFSDTPFPTHLPTTETMRVEWQNSRSRLNYESGKTKINFNIISPPKWQSNTNPSRLQLYEAPLHLDGPI